MIQRGRVCKEGPAKRHPYLLVAFEEGPGMGRRKAGSVIAMGTLGRMASEKSRVSAPFSGIGCRLEIRRADWTKVGTPTRPARLP